MRSFITILLLLIMVSVHTPLGQLFKVPFLIEHFVKHRLQDGVSLIGFFQDHYSSEHDDNGLPEDESLPFKNIPYYAIGYAMIPASINSSVFDPVHFDRKITFSNAYIPRQHSEGIFHPPRI